MKKNKKILSGLIALSVITSMSFSSIGVQAATKDTKTNISNVTKSDNKGTSVKVTKDKLNKIDSGVHLDMTVSGDGGSATLDPKHKSVYWKVKPATDWPYVFKGTLEVDYYNGESEYFNLSGIGALGSSVSDTVSLSGTGGYSVYLRGEATDLAGDEFTVLPDCEAGFGY
ncbi:hypothetical protein [uncultured Clostridium sp.]|uniref:hypothetical protein n=1 Tax=uncultured Clostridium sp. TaxID=59620 RepID=UPI0028EE677D|nr:hypothetical protein [uncultured Clostridium sp.]